MAKKILNIKRLSDKEIYELSKKYGLQAKAWRRKFVGLLPEIQTRGLYEKHGFFSIYEYAAKLGGVSKKQVQRVIQLEKKLEEKPQLKSILINGETSVNKLIKIAPILDLEKEKDLINKVKNLPCRTLETYVRDFKYERKLQDQNGLFEPKKRPESAHMSTLFKIKEVQKINALGLQLDENIYQKLLELQDKGININEILKNALEKRKEEIETEKEDLAKEILEKEESRIKEGKLPSKHVSVKIKKHLKKEHGNKCSIKHCHKDATTIHHTARFSLSQSHNPKFLAPLCSEHHNLAHLVDEKYRQHKNRK